METSTVTEQVKDHDQSDEDVEDIPRRPRPRPPLLGTSGFPRRQLASRYRSCVSSPQYDEMEYSDSDIIILPRTRAPSLPTDPDPSPVFLTSDCVDQDEPADDHDENENGNEEKKENENEDGDAYDASQMDDQDEEESGDENEEEELEQQRWKNILVSTLDELTARRILIPSPHPSTSTSRLMHFASTTTSCLSNTLVILSLVLLVIVLLIHLAMLTHIYM